MSVSIPAANMEQPTVQNPWVLSDQALRRLLRAVPKCPGLDKGDEWLGSTGGLLDSGFAGPLLSLGSGDNLNIRDRMNLPGGRSPVVCTARICILRGICVLRVKGHPTVNFDPLVKNLLA